MVSNNYYCLLDLQKWVMKREWSILFRQTRKKPVNHRCVLLSLKSRLVSVSFIRATRFLHASGTYKGNDVKFSIFNLVHWLLSMFFIVTIVTIHQVATCWKEHNSFLNIIILVLPLTIMLYLMTYFLSPDIIYSLTWFEQELKIAFLNCSIGSDLYLVLSRRCWVIAPC